MKKIELFGAIKQAGELVDNRIYMRLGIDFFDIKKVSVDTLKNVIAILHNELRKKSNILKEKNKPNQIAIRFGRAQKEQIKDCEEKTKQIAILEYEAVKLYNIISLVN